MRKSALTFVPAIALAVGLAGCNGAAIAPSDGSGQPAERQEAKAALDFDGSGVEDTGAGSMYLSTAAGTSEDGSVPEIVADDVTIMQIGINFFDGDGSVCTVYVDGMENMRMNAGNIQGSMDLQGDALKPGTHKVEVVAKDGDAVTLYKSAEYKIAE